MDISYYALLKPVVLGHLTHYRQDFEEQDRTALHGFQGRFLLGMRATGTNLLKFDGPERPEATFREIVEYFLFRANQRFLYGANGKVKEIPEAKAREIFEKACREGMTFFG
ncbi:MAG: hypothetical protein KJ558_10070 [Gammaproteobacteria bacterium]|nr:hypothetical protein [Gammaproteobacteria bacterium]MBU1655152.1 hypothetical protein [Gammaproteobacteria bacterium]MBU1959963.1 hypothetical protein [Gammaproteobacteria bacterium]